MIIKKAYDIASFKALPDDGDGTGRFEALVSVFGNVDYQGDRVMPGAFAKSIERWRELADPIPVIWSHEWGDPFAHIGFIDPKNVEEVAASGSLPGGLKVIGQLDVDKPFARQVYDLLKDRRVKEFSFAYDVKDERPGKDRANELHEVDLIEVGPTLKGANPDTISMGVKSRLEHAAATQRAAEVVATVQRMGAEVDDAKTLELISSADALDPEFGELLTRALTAPPPTADDTEKETDPEGAKYLYEELEGSEESRLRAIQRSVNSWADDAYPANDEGYRDAWACVVGTYPDRVIVSIETNDEPPRYLSFPYTVGDDGEVTLGDPTDVELDITVTAKSGEAKAATKPWRIEERDGKFCVIKEDDGEVEGCHDTREEAEEQMRALYASESTGTASINVEVSFAKAGRVIGSKAASALKARLTEAVDEFVAEVNGAAAAADPDPEEKSGPTPEVKSELEDLKSKLDSLSV